MLIDGSECILVWQDVSGTSLMPAGQGVLLTEGSSEAVEFWSWKRLSLPARILSRGFKTSI